MLASIRKWMRSYPLIVALIALAIGVGGILFVPAGSDLIKTSLLRIVLAAIMILIIVLAGGVAIFRRKPGTLGFSLKKGIYPLIVALVVGAISFYRYFAQFQSGEIEIAVNWPFIIVTMAILFLFVGLFEESLFRAICFDALITRLGSTKRGVIIAMIISSLIFGVVHILTSLIGGIDINSATILQMILKTLQTGMIGFLLAAIYYKTRNIWGVAIIHALSDFFEALPGALFGSGPQRVYITAGEAGNSYLIAYVSFLLLSIPFIIVALRIVKNAPLSTETIFTEAITSKNALEKH